VAQIGSNRITSAQSTNGVSDISGVPMISTFNDFGSSPLGIAARSQALYGIVNAQFNLLPQNQDDEIVDYQNPLPYWSCENYSSGRIVPKSFYDTTTGTWSVELNPTAGSAADYLELKTRSFLLTDDNLALRQKAYLTMSKGTAYAGATQFNVVLSAEYFDVNGASLSTYAIGTALDNTAMTSITGITTSGSAAISAAASYVDFTIKLTATATVTSGVKVYLKSFIIATSTAATGSFLITETITSSKTWTAPTGVSNLVAVVVGGAGGGGGGGGGIRQTNTIFPRAGGGGGGGGGAWTILRDVSLGTATSVSIGIGAGGTGGTAMNYTVTLAAQVAGTVVGGVGAAGGATTFGAYVSVPGGGGGGGGSALGTSATGTAAVGGTAGPAGGAATFTYFGGTSVLGGTGGVGGSATGAQEFNATAGGTSTGLAFANYPYSTFTAGGTGGNGSWTGGDRGSATNGVAGGSAHFGGGGGGGAGLFWTDSGSGGTNYTRIGTAGVGGAGGGAGGAGAAGARVGAVSSGTATIIAGTGGNAGSISIAGGGGGGGAFSYGTSNSNWTVTTKAGPGGTGSSGFVTVVYVA
jgi:hypothetical protein